MHHLSGCHGEKLVLRESRADAEFVAPALPPCGGELGGGSRARHLTLSQFGTNPVCPPPTLILPHKGGGDQTWARRQGLASRKRNKSKGARALQRSVQADFYSSPGAALPPIAAILILITIAVPPATAQASRPAEDQAIAALEKRGGRVFRDETLPHRPITMIDLDETESTDEDLVNLEVFSSIQSLSLDGTRISDAGLAHVSRLTSLTELSIDNTSIGDAGLAHLAGLKNLRKLSLDGTSITGAGLAHLKELSRLENLSMVGTKVDDAGAVILKGLTRLEWLILDGTAITDAALEQLKGSTNLEILLLNNTRITDAGLACLTRLTNLHLLSLERTQVTDEGVRGLEKVLSKTRIYH